jgi:hypothetical protein
LLPPFIGAPDHLRVFHVQNKILNIHVLLIHVSETYNTIMSLHVLGISVDVHIELIDNSLLK